MSTTSSIVTNTIKSMPVEITEGEAALFNSFPISEVVPALKHLIIEETDSTITARAFDAVMKLTKFDTVEFLISLFEETSLRKRFVCCSYLGNFPDDRAVQKLLDILNRENNVDLRYCAIESLAKIGDQTAIPVLEQIKNGDSSKDYEGFSISEIAQKALAEIKGRL